MTMKKYTLYAIILFVLLFIAAAILGLSYRKVRAEGYAIGYENGYSDARSAFEDTYSMGYRDGIARAQNAIESYLMDDVFHLSFEIEDNYGISPEDALNILANYVDIPGEVTESELNDAVWAIRRYYFDLYDIIHDIDNYWID